LQNKFPWDHDEYKENGPAPAPDKAVITGASMWLGDVQRSRRIAYTSHPVRDNLPAQRKIIAVCHQVLKDKFKVYVPQQGAPGATSFFQLKTFVELPHMVYRFLLRQVNKF
jgi:hypothetical protein